ncbi:hypothetical protein CQW23_24834 [Capsicum baccatum]|uniref:Ubiquitin-like protease family profile domain-containing protein n=1 Tax=Capsicum baccatum TaxID=33114 RepID=A0A2G2VVZ0_CAPBA|nr:hypothetical protein CQW23_24834 [Capsicum baccatum]
MLKAIEKSKGCTDLHPDKTNVEIESQNLIHDEILQSINLDYNLSDKIVHHDVLIIDEKTDGIKLSDSQFTIPDELLPSLNAYRRENNMTQQSTTREEEPSDEHFNDKKSKKTNVDHYKRGKSSIPMMHFGVETVEDKNWFYTMGFPDQSWTNLQIDVCFYYLRKKSKYDPNRFYKFSTVDCNFMNIIRSVYDAYSVDDASITPGGQTTHLNEYINGFQRYIFLYDSYESSGHYPVVLAKIKKLATIIPLCFQQCDFYIKKGIQVENHLRYKNKDLSDMFDVLFQENLPQQSSESLDCGVYMVTYAECLSYGHKVLANEFDPNALEINSVCLEVF